MTANYLALLQFSPRRLRVETFQLVVHLGRGGLSGIDEGAIKFGEPFADRGHAGFQRLVRRIEGRLQIPRQAALRQLLTQRLRSAERIADRQSVAFEQPLNLRLHQCGGKARHKRSDSLKQHFVHRARLRKIGSLGRAAGISKRGQQIVLHDRPEQHIGTEEFGVLLHPAQQVGLRKLLRSSFVVNDEFGVVAVQSALNRRSRSVVQRKHEYRRRRDLHLLVIAGGFERFSARQQRVFELVSAFHGRAIDWLGKAM